MDPTILIFRIKLSSYISFMRTVNIYPISSNVCFIFMLDPQGFQTISQLDIPPNNVFLQCVQPEYCDYFI